MSPTEYQEPRSLEEACALVARYGEDGKILAGGTALVLLMRQRLLAPGCLINVQRVAGLGGITTENGHLVFGALATHAEAAESTLVRSQYPALAETFARVATPRIRHAGTVGGNLAHGDPHLDPPVTLLALDGTVTAHSTRGPREIPLGELFVDYYETSLAPDEVLTRVAVPVRQPRTGLAFLKFLPRSQDDYATADVAAWVRLAEDQRTIQEARVALGSVGPIPFRALEAEALLAGTEVQDDLLAEVGARAAVAADPEDDVRGSAAYKREVLRAVVPRVVRQALADARVPVAAGGNGAVHQR